MPFVNTCVWHHTKRVGGSRVLSACLLSEMLSFESLSIFFSVILKAVKDAHEENPSRRPAQATEHRVSASIL